MAGTYLPLAAVLLATAVTLLVATSSSSVPVAAAAADKYSGRMVIIRAPGARVVSAGAGSALSKWQQRRLVEDEVAPELGGLQVADYHGVVYGAFDPNHHVCLPNCAEPGQRYTRPCAATYGCPNSPTAGHARAVHV